MKFKINNKTYRLRPWVKVVLLFICAILVFFCIKPFLGHSGNENPNSDKPYSSIVIDAGHGGPDVGAIALSDNQVYERDLALEYAKELGKQIEAINPNFKVYYTRTGKEIPWVEDDSPQFELDDLNGRTKFANDIRPDFFISIHFNSNEDTSVHGYTGFIKSDDTVMKEVFQSIEKNLSANNWSQSLEVHTNEEYSLQLVDYIKGHTMLYEVGFLSNEEELKKLQDPENRVMITKAIAKAYCDQIEK